MPALLWTLAFFLVPFVFMLVMSLWKRVGLKLIKDLSFDNYFAFFEKPHFIEGLLNSLEITFSVTFLSVLLAYPLAWIIAMQVPQRLQRAALLLAIIPFWTSYVVRSYAWLLVLAHNGIVNQTLIGAGIEIGRAHV